MYADTEDGQITHITTVETIEEKGGPWDGNDKIVLKFWIVGSVNCMINS